MKIVQIIFIVAAILLFMIGCVVRANLEIEISRNLFASSLICSISSVILSNARNTKWSE